MPSKSYLQHFLGPGKKKHLKTTMPKSQSLKQLLSHEAQAPSTFHQEGKKGNDSKQTQQGAPGAREDNAAASFRNVR